MAQLTVSPAVMCGSFMILIETRVTHHKHNAESAARIASAGESVERNCAGMSEAGCVRIESHYAFQSGFSPFPRPRHRSPRRRPILVRATDGRNVSEYGG